MVNFEKLSSVCSIQNGYAFKSSDYREDGIPLLRISNFDNGDVFLNDKQIFLKEEFLKSKKDFIVNKGDVLIALSGATTGKYGVYNFNYPSLLNQRIGLIKSSNSDKLDNRYFMHYLNVMQKEILRNAAGAAQPNISTNKIGNFKIPLPPLETQKRIAKILDNAAALREKTEQLLTEYDALAQSIFLDMFGDPVINPKGWEFQIWNDCLEIRNGKNQKNVIDENGEYPIYGSGGIMAYAKDYISDKNTVIIGRKGNINKPILVKEPYWNVDTAFGLHPNRDILHYNYLFKFCQIYNFEKHNTTTTIPSLTKNILYKIKIPIPPIELQNEFAEKIELIEKQKELAKQELKESEDLFNALLQKAFKGELV